MILDPLHTYLSFLTKPYLCLIIPLIGIVALYFFYDTDYHNLNLYVTLGDAFLSGRTDIPPGYGGDVSFFNGKYYLYWGPVPALLVYIPIKLLTGIAVDGNFMVPFQASIGTVCLSILSYRIASCQRPVNALGLIFVVLSIGLGSWIPLLCRGTMVYEAAISGAYCFSAMGALFLWIFLNNQQKIYWAVLASLCLGLAVGCRVTYAANIVMLLAGCIAILHTPIQCSSKSRYIVWLLIPWLFCIAALGVYNYERFGNPFEIGNAYQVHNQVSKVATQQKSGLLQPCITCSHTFINDILSHNNMAYNTYYYLFHPLQFKNPITFPHIFEEDPPSSIWVFGIIQSLGTIPINSGPTPGLLTNSPFSLWYFIFLCDRWARKNWLPVVRTIVTGVELYSVIAFLFLAALWGPVSRYAVDFAPWMMTLGGIYYLNLLQRAKSNYFRRLLLITGGLATIYGVFTGTIYMFCGDMRCGI